MKESGTTRRSFVAKLLAGSLLAGASGILATIIAYLIPPGEVSSALGPKRVKVGGVDDIPVGEGKLILVDDELVWVLRLATGFVAMSAWCTHKGCIVKWAGRQRRFECPCHEGRFDEHGNVVSGLPLRPLPRYPIGVVQGDVYVLHAGRRQS